MIRKLVVGLVILGVGIGAYLYFKPEEKASTFPSEGSGNKKKSFRVAPDTTMISSSPNFNEAKAQQYEKEIKELIAQRKYEFIKETELDNGIKCYLYKFVLSDGEEMTYGCMTPLPKKE